LSEVYDSYEREVRDLPCLEYRTTVVVELYRVRCPDCGVKTEKVPQLPSKAPFSERFEEAVGLACESAAARRVARQFELAASTVRAIDLRYPATLGGGEKEAGVAADGSGRDLSGEEAKVSHGSQQSGNWGAIVVWAGTEERNEFFQTQLSKFQCTAIRAACVAT
jgi:transposase